MYKYKVIDTIGFHDPVVIQLPFTIDPAKQAQYVVMARYAILMALAIEKMVNKPLSEISPEILERMMVDLEYSQVV